MASKLFENDIELKTKVWYTIKNFQVWKKQWSGGEDVIRREKKNWELLAPIYGLEPGGHSCLKAEDRAKK